MNSPLPGHFVIVRNRPAIVRNIVESEQTSDGKVLHLVEIEYIDDYDFPREDRIIWEREISAQVFASFDFPEIGNPLLQPDKPELFWAFVDALRWSSQGSYSTSEGNVIHRAAKIKGPWYSAIQVEDYQLFPVLKALAMPSANLLLSDDVGLGKTIEAGLIGQELIRQRHIRRILIICPSSLQIQWQDEMKEKFNIDFTILDSNQFFSTKKNLGMDANPWKIYPRIIVSMDYLKQPDILNAFTTTSEQSLSQGSAMLPWDLLIVDEAHNLSPSHFADDSYRCEMLRKVSMFCEHHLFLSATPHNGYTVSFTGLLEMLDPVRFQQKATLDQGDLSQIGLVMVRRMKEELNKGKETQRFPNRFIEGIPLEITDDEARLYKAVRKYRLDITRKMGKVGKREKILAEFIFSVLTKRLLSSSYAFAKTWWNHVAGFGLEGFGYDEAEESKKRAEMPVEDDDEKESREQDAVRHGAGWLNAYLEDIQPYVDSINKELKNLGWSSTVIKEDLSHLKLFPRDKKFDRLHEWIESYLMNGNQFKSDERVIIFTEYKHTLEYLVARFRSVGIEEPEIRTLYGGVTPEHRRLIKDAFNDPTSSLRILVATEVAAEGLNLQNSCRYVIHQEIPWNPMRLEQRNGRVDRHGQSRNVYVFHFVSDQVEELKFLDFIVKKVDTARKDLGSIGKILDEAVLEYFSKGQIDASIIDDRMEKTHKFSDEEGDLSQAMHGSEAEYTDALREFDETQKCLEFDEEHLARLLNEAMQLEGGSLKSLGEGTYRIEKTPPRWTKLIEKTILLDVDGVSGAHPKLVFSPERVQELINGKMMFHPRKDTRLLMLGHPLMQKSLSSFRRRLWLNSVESNLRKWTVEEADLPKNTSCIFCLYFDIGLRNQLGERFNTGILEVPVKIGSSLETLTQEDWGAVKKLERTPVPASEEYWKNVMELVRLNWYSVKTFAVKEKSQIVENIKSRIHDELSNELKRQISEQRELYRERQKSLDLHKNSKSMERLRKELQKAAEKAYQLTFDEELNRIHQQKYESLKEKIHDSEWERQHSYVTALKERLNREEKRVIERVLPRRFTLDEEGIEVNPTAVYVLVSRGRNQV